MPDTLDDVRGQLVEKVAGGIPDEARGNAIPAPERRA